MKLYIVVKDLWVFSDQSYRSMWSAYQENEQTGKGLLNTVLQVVRAIWLPLLLRKITKSLQEACPEDKTRRLNMVVKFSACWSMRKELCCFLASRWIFCDTLCRAFFHFPSLSLKKRGCHFPFCYTICILLLSIPITNWGKPRSVCSK